jgi:indolepyruvate ferredoxin oxidoreductase beta subunit
MKQPIGILIAALGGEGGGVLAEWLVETALQAGYPAQSTSIPGVAQRTGATTYYVEIFGEPESALGERRPVLSLLPVPGCLDLVVASELLEAARNVQAGMVSPERTILLTSTGRTLTTAEKLSLGDGRFDSDRLIAVARQHSRRLLTLDMEAIAREAGSAISAVMLGAIAGSGVLPFKRGQFEAVIKASGIGVDSSLRGFALACERIAEPPDRSVRDVAKPGETGRASMVAAIAGSFPAATHDIIAAGYARLVEYQDERYAALYLERLARILAAERRSDPAGAHALALTRETARFLALWMAFDDIVRVAQLKCRASRFARVRREVAAKDGDIVRIVDYFKPGIPEMAGLIPRALARRLVSWDRRRQGRGKEAVAVRLLVRTDGVFGFAVLRLLAGLRGMRRRGARYAQEQEAIEHWLAAVDGASRHGWNLAQEIALCGRLIKGYGATNERGKANLTYILAHLAEGGSFATPVARASAIRHAREAALTDEAGTALDRTLAQHGVAPRPAVAQPVRWIRKSAPAGSQHRAA